MQIRKEAMTKAFSPLIALLLAVLLALPCPGRAEKTENPETAATMTADTLEERIEELQGRITAYTESDDEKTAEEIGISAEELKKRTEILQEQFIYLNRQVTARKKKENLDNEKKLLEEHIASGEALRLETAPPYPINLYDTFFDRLAESLRKKESTELSLAIARKALAKSHDNAREAGRRVRQLREEHAGGSAADQLPLNWEATLQVMREELAGDIVAYQELAVENARQELALADMRLDIDRQIVDRIREHLIFTRNEYEKIIADIELKEKELQEASDSLLKKLQKHELQLHSAQRQAEKAAGDNETAVATAIIAAADAWRQAYQNRLENNEATQQLLTLQKRLWGYRYAVLGGHYEEEDLAAWRQEAMAEGDRLQTHLSLPQELLRDLLLQQDGLEEKISGGDLPSGQKHACRNHLEALAVHVESLREYIIALGVTNQLIGRFLHEADMSREQVTFAEIARQISRAAAGLWSFEIVAVDGYSVTLGKIISALAIFFAGIVLSRRLTRKIQTNLHHHGNMSESTAAIAGKLIHYLLLLIIILFALRIVNIPLTVFAYLGGAVAIGVGFGAQKLLSNFISGFILMAEQPVKVGDLVQMNDQLGRIENIGVRATMVRTFANINILVPNSYFLENNIINWTHNDNHVRCEIRVGVGYDSPADKVRELLVRAACDHGLVHSAPPPVAMLSDFGENALIFDLFFWMTISADAGRQQIESDVRFHIDSVFREAGITIAFPQRDIHLDSSRPLQFECLQRNRQADPPP